ncbi:MAG TPA: hypothetical protein VMZ92_00620 [Planctomycetota bacterium]|nr:hypothetical protein [Planctomycetota bacterium]
MKKLTKWILLGSAGLLLMAAACAVLTVIIVSRFIGCIADERYELPAAAEIVEKDVGTSDFHGDFDYCARFALSETELDKLRGSGFNWAPMRKGFTSKAQWQQGVLPKEVMGLMSNLDVRLKDAPQGGASYTYLYEWVDGGWWRLFVIDEKTKVVYYYRCTW